MWTRFGDFDSMLARMNAFRRDMDRLFGEFERGPRWGHSGWDAGWPRTNLFDTGNTLTVQAEVPGLRADDIDAQLQANRLTIRGERKDDAPEGYSVHRRERAPVRFSRSFTLPVEVDPEQVTATVTDGVLTLELGKAQQALPRQITVKAS